MIFGKPTKYLLLLIIAVFASSTLKAETKDQQIKVTLRAIGHAFLLELKDSTSRILPIEKIDGRYAVKFERPFSFQPDLLAFITWKVLTENKIEDNFIVETENCTTHQVVHSFETDLSKQDSTTACQFRFLPEDCYIFYFTLVGNGTAADTNLTNNATEETAENTAPTGSSSKIIYLIIIFILLLITGVLYYFKTKKKNQKSKSTLIQIGKFQFDQKSMLLQLKAQSIELSSKEADLLFLLFSNENKTLEREYILNIVWGDTGDYVGRTLDVFISKLRKKLEADASLKIINIRGVGYKFVMG